MDFKVFVTFLLCILKSSSAAQVGCEDFINETKWDCNTYKYYFQAHNLRHTLHCLSYDEDTQPTPKFNLNLNRIIKRIRNVNDNDKTLTLEENIRIDFIDPRLNFNDCENVFRYDQDASKYLWKPDFETFDGTSYRPKLDIARLSKVSFDFIKFNRSINF